MVKLSFWEREPGVADPCLLCQALSPNPIRLLNREMGLLGKMVSFHHPEYGKTPLILNDFSLKFMVILDKNVFM
jgi:hypothetical protein